MTHFRLFTPVARSLAIASLTGAALLAGSLSPAAAQTPEQNQKPPAAAAATSSKPETVEQRITVRMAATNAIHKAREAVDFAYNAAGATAIFENHPLERRFRGGSCPMGPQGSPCKGHPDRAGCTHGRGGVRASPLIPRDRGGRS